MGIGSVDNSQSSINFDVHNAVQTHLSFIDETLPGLCIGYYLVGSIALGDYCPGQSDIDFVAVLSKKVDDTILKELERISIRLISIRDIPKFDGIYVWPSLLREYPSGDEVPYVLDGRFHRTGAFAANPITWLTLTRYPCPIRECSGIEIWSNEKDIKDWCLRNINEHWSRWIKRIQYSPFGIIRSLFGKTVQWGVLGVVRLHATIVEGKLISKSEAAVYAMGVVHNFGQ